MRRDTRFWVSWVQTTEDFRPLTDPPNRAILGWWCSGETDRGVTLCAAVKANSPSSAEQAVMIDWPEAAGEFRFVEEQSTDWTPGDRFPITRDWEKKRFAKAEDK
jgi:hypothetical protein